MFACNFRNILEPTLVGVFFFISLSSTFIIGYIFVDYQKYVKTYQASQIQETVAINEKIQATLGNLKALLKLTEARIHATYGNSQNNSKDNSQQIQKILSSLHHLQFHQSLPDLQKASYSKLSPPQMILTRFGILPLNSKKMALEKMSPTNSEPMFVFENKEIKGTATILNLQGSLEGVLEIQVEIDAFIKFLGVYKTVDLMQSFPSQKIETPISPLSIYNKPPDSFLAYVLACKSHYVVFAAYILFVLVFNGFYLYFLYLRLQKNYRHKFETLEDALFTIGMSEKALRKELGMHQQNAHIHQISSQARKKLQANLKRRQQEQASHVSLSLKSIQQSLKNPLIQLGDIERMETLNACIAETDDLSGGVWNSKKKEFVDFKEFLHNFHQIFAEKIHKFNITIETQIVFEAMPFQGDPLLIEVLLINAIGKPLHRVPKDGNISISLKEIPGFLHLEVRDNGYAGAEVTEKLIRKSSGLFMTEEAFHQTCLNNGMRYRYAKANGFNVTHLMIPNPEEEVSNSNVVQLFS